MASLIGAVANTVKYVVGLFVKCLSPPGQKLNHNEGSEFNSVNSVNSYQSPHPENYTYPPSNQINHSSSQQVHSTQHSISYAAATASPYQAQEFGPTAQLSVNSFPQKPLTKSIVGPTAAELESFPLALSKLWDLDRNRLVPGEDFVLNLQGYTRVHQQGDFARDPLFSFVNPMIFTSRPTFSTFYKLLDNYTAETGTPEIVTNEELAENNRFIDAVMVTDPMIYLHQILIARKSAPNSVNEFKNMLKSIWFKLYKREVRDDSSSFEHVFVGEVKNGEVSGMHNWIQIWNEEKAGNLNYHGYIPVRGKNNPPHKHILSLQFSWKNNVKRVSTSFIGVSPEFELALYTLCFLAGAERNKCNIEGVDLCIICHTFQDKAGRRLGTSYPDIQQK